MEQKLSKEDKQTLMEISLKKKIMLKFIKKVPSALSIVV